jgi:hypothetical protein
VPHFAGPRWVPGQVNVPPPHLSTDQPTLPPAQTQSGSSSPVALTVIFALLGIGLAAILWLVLRAALRARGRRKSLPSLGAVDPTPPPLPADADAEAGEPDAPVVHRGLLRALEALDEDREPADAVVKAWLGLQAAAEDSGVQRRAAETPTEFTARVITRVKADAAAASGLVDVYQAVRFGAHPITSAEVRSARAAIERLLDSWHDPILRARR